MTTAGQVYLAVDLGASSGRVVAGVFDGERLANHEVHRFDNGGIPMAGGLYWDVLGLWKEIVHGLRKAHSEYGSRIRGVGVDTWGVDYALLGRGDVLLENPRSYRDHRTRGMLDRVTAKVSRGEIFRQTGLQFMEINTLFQLAAMREARSQILDMAESFLMIPDLFHWMLTGTKANEFTIASTSQFYDPTRGAWATPLLESLDIPTKIFGDIIQPGTNLGRLRNEVVAETGLAGVEVVAPGTHDTASAVLAVPAEGSPSERPSWCYLSSGTWSLMGVETPRPIINDHALAMNFTNEGGVGGTIRVLKNIIGLWLLQECRRKWAHAGFDYPWDTMTRLAAEAEPFSAFINPNDPVFVAPADMPEEILGFCRRTGQAVPQDHGTVVRVALESLALRYRQVLEYIEALVGNRVETVHIVGGGTRNQQLCQMTANACGRRVVAGPIEATAIGNVAMQAIATGALSGVEEARRVIRESFPVVEYEPRDASTWEAAYARYLQVATK